jgi:phosphoserine phosphatase
MVPPVSAAVGLPSLVTPISHTVDFLNQLGVHVSGSQTPPHVLRSIFAELREQKSEALKRFLSPGELEGIKAFTEQQQPELSDNLLEVLNGNMDALRVMAQDVCPQFFQSLDQDLARSEPLDAAAFDDFRKRIQRLIHVNRPSHEIPAAVSLSDVLANPGRYTAEDPLEIVLSDVDGTTRRKQYSPWWLGLDVIPYGPKETTGVSWLSILKALPGIFSLLRQEKSNGDADHGQFDAVFGKLLPGLDEKRARRSLERFYRKYGSRDLSPFMKDQFLIHRQQGRLILLVSAAPELLVQMHAKTDLVIPTENVLGTEIVFGADGKATGKFKWLHGPKKVTALEARIFQLLRQRGIPFRICAAYSDSPSDMPILELAARDGGLVYLVNAFKQSFIEEGRARGWGIVEEEDGWTRPGTQIVSHGPVNANDLIHDTRRSLPPIGIPPLVTDIGPYALRVASDALGFALVPPVLEVAKQAVQGVENVNLSSALLADSPSVAVSAFIASAMTSWLVPPDGSVAGNRTLFRGAIPMTAALMASGHQMPVGSSSALSLGVTFLVALMAASGVEAVTIGEKLTGLRAIRGGDEASSFIRRTLGFLGLRTAQIVAFEALVMGLQHLIS